MQVLSSKYYEVADSITELSSHCFERLYTLQQGSDLISHMSHFQLNCLLNVWPAIVIWELFTV